MLNNLIPIVKKGQLFIVSGPAGSGKTTLVDMLHEEFPLCIKNVSYTTREKRVGELEGKDYFFITKEQFLKKIEQEDFLDHTSLFGNFYGVSKSWVERWLLEGKHLFLVVDVDGGMAIKKKMDSTTIFILPPSGVFLAERLKKRSTENEILRKERLDRSEYELSFSKEYDYSLVNDQLEEAYQVFRSIVIATLHKNERRI